MIGKPCLDHRAKTKKATQTELVSCEILGFVDAFRPIICQNPMIGNEFVNYYVWGESME